MSLITAVSDSISRLGGEVSITADDHSVSARAIVEPLRYRNKIYIGGEMHHLVLAPCGEVREDDYEPDL